MKNIFISSTFIDMQAERDLVQERVLPALRDEARKYGDNVGVIDLRWGVDTSTLETEEGAAKVLQVCLDEIDRSHPYMLIFLGERYGTMMREDQIEKSVRGREDKYTTNDYVKSITALEVEYGALSEKYGELNHCVVCFREPVVHILDGAEKALYAEHTEEGKRKLEALKERIKQDLGEDDRLITYSCTWDKSARQLVDFKSNGQPLENVLTNCFVEMFRDDWKKYENLSWQDKEQLAFRALMESKLRSFVGREELLEEYYQSAVNGTCPIILQGEVGSGKTAIMCKLVERLQKEGKNVFAFFAGAGSMSTNAESLVKQMVYYMENLLGVEKRFDEKQYKRKKYGLKSVLGIDEKTNYVRMLEYLGKLVLDLPSQEKVFFCLDALEQLYFDEHVENLDFFFKGEQIQIIASCTTSFELPMRSMVDREEKMIAPLSENDAKRVAESILTSYSRNVYESIEREILMKAGIENPLYVSLLIQRLNMMDAEELSRAMDEEEIIEIGKKAIQSMPGELESATMEIIKKGIARMSVKEEALKEALCFLAVSRNGLRMQDLQKLFELNGHQLSALDVTCLLKYLDIFFYINEDGRIEFANKVIRQGVLNEVENKEEYEERIYKYLKGLAKGDSFRIQEGMYYARIMNDYDLGEQMFEMSIQSEREDVIKAIKNEALADEGAFYCKLIEMQKEELSEESESVVCEFFFRHIWVLFGIKQKESTTLIKIVEVLLMYAEEGKEKYRNVYMEKYVSLQYYIGSLMQRQGRFQDALDHLKKVKEEIGELSDKGSAKQYADYLCVCYQMQGMIYATLKCSGEAIHCSMKAIEYAKIMCEVERNDDNLSALADCYSYHSNVLSQFLQEKEALIFCEESLKINEELQKRGRDVWLALVLTYGSMGQILLRLERYEEALGCQEQQKQCLDAIGKNERNEQYLVSLISYYANSGMVLSKLGRQKDACLLYRKGIDICEELQDISKNELVFDIFATLLVNEGGLMLEAGRMDEALKNQEKALRIREELYARNENDRNLSELSFCYIAIGRILFRKNSYEDSLECFEHSLKIRENLFRKEKNEPNLRFLEECYDYVVDTLIKLERYGDVLECAKKQMGFVGEIQAKDNQNVNEDMLLESCRKVKRIVFRLEDELVSNVLLDVKLAELGHKKISSSAMSLLPKSFSLDEYLTKYHGEMARQREKIEKEVYQEGLCAILIDLGTALFELGEKEEAQQLFEKAIACGERLFIKEENVEKMQVLTSCYIKVSEMMMKSGKKDSARHYCSRIIKQSIELHKKLGSMESLIALSDNQKLVGEFMIKTGSTNSAMLYFKDELMNRREVVAKEENVQSLGALSRCFCNLGNVFSELGQQEKARSYYENAMDKWEKMLAIEKEKNWLKYVRGTSNDIQNICYAERLYEVTMMERCACLLIRFYDELINVLLRKKNFEKSLEYCKAAIAFVEKLCKKDNDERKQQDLSRFCWYMGEVLVAQGRLQESLPYLEKGVKGKEKQFERNGDEKIQHDLHKAYSQLGDILLGFGKKEESISYFEKNVKCCEKLLGISRDEENKYRLTDAYNKLGKVFYELGKCKDAMIFLKKAIQYAEALYTERPVSENSDWKSLILSSTFTDFAEVLLQERRTAKAREMCEKVLKIYDRRKLDVKNPISNELRKQMVKTLIVLAEANMLDNRIKQGYDLYSQAVENSKRVHKSEEIIYNARDYVVALKGMYICLFKLERKGEAIEYLSLAKEEAKKLYEHSGAEKDKKLLEELLGY